MVEQRLIRKLQKPKKEGLFWFFMGGGIFLALGLIYYLVWGSYWYGWVPGYSKNLSPAFIGIISILVGISSIVYGLIKLIKGERYMEPPKKRKYPWRKNRI